MATIRIERVTDHHDCETCGCSLADGARVYFDGELGLELTPSGWCFDGVSYEDDEIYAEILKSLGSGLVYSSEQDAFRRAVLALGHAVEID